MHRAVSLRDRLPALSALALPTLAGLAWMASQGAPRAYLALDSFALVLGLVLAAFAREPREPLARRVAIACLIAVLFVPNMTGPHLNGIARWLPLGPVSLHAGMLALPPLAVLAAREENYAAPILLAALLAAFLQPDAASGFAVTFAAVGLHHVSRDWQVGAVAIIGFFSAIFMSLVGELPPQRFVENVVWDALRVSIPAAIGLSAALASGYLLIVFAAPLPRAQRLALAGTLFGFVAMAVMNYYPYPFIGHGAAPIIGFGLALGLVRMEKSE